MRVSGGRGGLGGEADMVFGWVVVRGEEEEKRGGEGKGEEEKEGKLFFGCCDRRWEGRSSRARRHITEASLCDVK